MYVVGVVVVGGLVQWSLVVIGSDGWVDIVLEQEFDVFDVVVCCCLV